jgi:hypothetical protein
VFSNRSLDIHLRHFEDALSFAVYLYQRFGTAESASLVNCVGGIAETYALHPVTADPTNLAEIGCAIAGINPTCLTLLLISARSPAAAAVMTEHDVDLWHNVHARCVARGVHLVDWLVTDGTVVRSMALSCASDSDWSIRPPEPDA